MVFLTFKLSRLHSNLLNYPQSQKPDIGLVIIIITIYPFCSFQLRIQNIEELITWYSSLFWYLYSMGCCFYYCCHLNLFIHLFVFRMQYVDRIKFPRQQKICSDDRSAADHSLPLGKQLHKFLMWKCRNKQKNLPKIQLTITKFPSHKSTHKLQYYLFLLCKCNNYIHQPGHDRYKTEKD